MASNGIGSHLTTVKILHILTIKRLKILKSHPIHHFFRYSFGCPVETHVMLLLIVLIYPGLLGYGVCCIINIISIGPLPLFVFLRRLMGVVVVFPSQLTQNSDLRKGWQAVLVHHPTAARATGDFAGDIGIGAFPFEVSEEENILTMDSAEGVPDLERLTGIEVAISNRSRGGKARVSEFGIQKEAHQFFIIRVESITRE